MTQKETQAIMKLKKLALISNITRACIHINRTYPTIKMNLIEVRPKSYFTSRFFCKWFNLVAGIGDFKDEPLDEYRRHTGMANLRIMVGDPDFVIDTLEGDITDVVYINDMTPGDVFRWQMVVRSGGWVIGDNAHEVPPFIKPEKVIQNIWLARKE